jgi:MFS family permease
MYSYFIPVFAQSFGASYLDLGLIGSAWALTTAITPMLAGHVADKINRAWMFSLSLIINAFATLSLIFARSVTDIVIFRMIGGIGLGGFWLTAEILVTDLAPVGERVKEMGKYGIALALGALVGPLVGGLVIEFLGYVDLFMASFLVIGASLALAGIWIVPRYGRNGTPSQSHSGNISAIRGLLPWYMMLLCYGAVWGVITSIFPGYANSVGISAALIGILFSAFGLTRIFSFATAHRYMKFGERRALLFISLMIFAGLLTLAALPSFLGFLAGIMLIGAGVGVVFPISINLISRHFPVQRAGVAIGSYETAVNWGETLGPYLAGVIASGTNVAASFLIMSVFGLLMATFAANGRTYQPSV